MEKKVASTASPFAIGWLEFSPIPSFTFSALTIKAPSVSRFTLPAAANDIDFLEFIKTKSSTALRCTLPEFNIICLPVYGKLGIKGTSGTSSPTFTSPPTNSVDSVLPSGPEPILPIDWFTFLSTSLCTF